MPTAHPASKRGPDMAPRPDGGDGRETAVPPTAVRWLPILVVTFGLNMLIDLTTDWPMLVRWLVALAGGIVVQLAVVRIWAARQR
jgi:hypothetical protein